MNPQFDPKKGTRAIEWTDLTWGVMGGCLHECQWEMPDGKIVECYAKTVAEFIARRAYDKGFAHYYWRPHKLEEPLKIEEPSFIFTDSMADMFGRWVPKEDVLAMLDVMRRAHWHTFQSLTKAPGVLMKYLDHLPPNLWVGVSSPPDYMEGKRLTRNQQERMLEKSLDVLRAVGERVPVTFMSFEPLSWDVSPYLKHHPLKWGIIGAGSAGRNYYQPNPDDVDRLEAALAGIPIFYKGNLDHQPRREEFPGRSPAVLRRQEMAKEHGWPLNTFLLEEEPAAAPLPTLIREVGPVYTILPPAQLSLFG